MAVKNKRNDGIIPVVVAVGVTVITLVGILLLKNNSILRKSDAAAVYETKTVELTPYADAYVSKSSPSTNYGTKTQLFSGGTGTDISYLSFDTSNIVGKNLSNVKLTFKIENPTVGSQTLSFVLSNSWGEKTINWNNKPSLTQKITSFDAKNAGPLELDLTPLIGNAKLAYNKISIGINSSSKDLLILGSREGNNSPKLLVSYVELVERTPEPTVVPSQSPRGTTIPKIDSSPSVSPSATPGNTGAYPGIDTNDRALGNSHAFGLWHPWISKVTGKVVDTCNEAIHNSYYVVGPDGLRYPTWHPAIDSATGCTFGHEHGLEPTQFVDISKVKKLYAFDGVDGCPKDNVISSCEINAKHTGVPFGYVNEVYSAYSASKGMSAMRHEDHYGHKVKYMNNEVIDQGNVAGSGSANDRYDTGVRCNFFGKIHMGVTTKDAFTNNLHEIIEYMRCTDGVEYSIAKLGKFGAAGEFLASCTGTQSENRDNCGPNIIKTGLTAMNKDYPGTCSNGNRSILSKKCLQELMFVDPDKFSGNLYESWNTITGLKTVGGASIVTTDMTIDVNDSIRNYDPSQPDNVAYNVDICDDKSPVSGKVIRGGFCDRVTNYHKNPIPSWDDPKALTGTNRGMYFSHPWNVSNAGKSAYKLSDPFGENAVDTTENAVVPAGYIKQYVSSINFQWNNLYKGTLMPNNTNLQHDTGNGSVHAPN